MQLAGGLAQPCQDQDLRHHRPGNLFSSGRECLFQKIEQPYLPAQMQPDPGTTKGPLPLDRNPLQIDFYPLRLDLAEQSPLSNGCSTLGLLVEAQTSCRIQLTQIGHHTLPRTARGARALPQ